MEIGRLIVRVAQPTSPRLATQAHDDALRRAAGYSRSTFSMPWRFSDQANADLHQIRLRGTSMVRSRRQPTRRPRRSGVSTAAC